MNLTKFFLLFILSLNASALTLEEERKYDELEGLPFIRALNNDKKYAEVVKQFPGVSKIPKDLGELYYYLSEAHFQLKDYKRAIAALEKGSKFTRTNHYSSLWGRTAEKLKKYAVCSQQFSYVPEKEIQSADWPVYFNCLLNNKEEAIALKLSLNSKLENPDFFLEVQKVLKAFGLRSIAEEKRKSYLNTCRSVEFYLNLWEITADVQVLETGHACAPSAMEITAAFVKALFNDGKYHTIAYLFEQLSIEDQTYLKHVAEFYKVAGRNLVADYFFTLGAEDDFILARSAHYLNKENYAGLLTVPFRPHNTQKNPDLNYALAYSHFKYLALDNSLSALARTKKSTRDQQLESLISQCRELDWRCRP